MAIPPAPRHAARETAEGQRDGHRDHGRGRYAECRNGSHGEKRVPARMTERRKERADSQLSPISKKVRHFDKYSRMGGSWSWNAPSYQRDVVNLVKAERRMEEDIASALTEVDAIEAGLRYFDELIMPREKDTPEFDERNFFRVDGVKKGTGAVHAVKRPPPRKHSPDENSKVRIPRVRREFCRSLPGEKTRQGSAASANPGHKRNGLGNVVSRDVPAVADRCTDLKLTLKQRLDNYDRLRGVNVRPPTQGAGLQPPTTLFYGDEHAGGEGRQRKEVHTEIGDAAQAHVTADEKPIPAGCKNRGGMIAPCEGGALNERDNAESVRRIIGRSLGKAVATIRRRSTSGEEFEKGKHRGKGRGSRSDHNDSAPKPGMYSWLNNQPPVLANSPTAVPFPPASLSTAGSGAAGSATRVQATRKLESLACTDRDCTDSSQSVLITEMPTMVRSRPSNFPDRSSSAGSRDDTTNGACDVKQMRSTAPIDLTSTPPLIPQVAYPTGEMQRGNVKARGARLEDGTDQRLARTTKTKGFDPDKLECVKRHELSVRERSRQVQAMRKQEEQKSLFRALPLPAFLRTGVDTPNDAKFWTGGMPTGDGRFRGGAALDKTRPELLAALKQDPEAIELMQKMRKVNVRAGTTPSLLWSGSTPPTIPSTLVDARSHCEDEESPSLRGQRAKPPPGPIVDTARRRQVPGTNEGASSAAMLPVGTNNAIILRPQHDKQSTLACFVADDRESGKEGDEGADAQERIKDGAEDADRSILGSGGQRRGSPLCADGDKSGEKQTSVDGRSDDSDSRRRTTTGGSVPRSLMGRMLESGMLNRQREWAKARCRKVLESRRRAAEDKDLEGKHDVTEAGFGERSWLTAKLQHSKSLERQEAEEKMREKIREARRRASRARAQHERDLAEKQAASIAAENLTPVTPSTVDLNRAGHATEPRHFERDGTDRTSRPRRRRRSNTHSGKEGISESDTGLAPPTLAVSASPSVVEKLSEGDFYRVAVQKVMDREQLSHGGNGTGANTLATLSATRVEGGHGVSIEGRALRQHDGPSTKPFPVSGRAQHPTYPSYFAPQDVPFRRKGVRIGSICGPQRRRSSAKVAKAGRGKSPAAASYRDDQICGDASHASTGTSKCTMPLSEPSSTSTREIDRNASLLSLYEAQSVERFDSITAQFCEESVTSAYNSNKMFNAGEKVITASQHAPTNFIPNLGGKIIVDHHDATSDRRQNDFQQSSDDGNHRIDRGIFSQCPWSEESAERNQGASERSLLDGRFFDERQGDDRTALDEVDFEGQKHQALGYEPSGAHCSMNPSLRRSSMISARETISPDLVSHYTQRRECTSHITPVAPTTKKAASHLPLTPEPWVTTAVMPELVPTKHAGGDDPFSLLSSSDDHAIVTRVGFDVDNEGVGGLGVDPQITGGDLVGRAGMVAASHSAEVIHAGPRDADRFVDDSSVFPPLHRVALTEGRDTFFDPATSSADKGRLKIRDPRLFDPASMHRKPDEIVTNIRSVHDTNEARKEGVDGSSSRILKSIEADHEEGSGVCASLSAPEITVASTPGVTLLVGCRVRDRNLPEQSSYADEQVITVMFDRSRFNEDEARRWWGSNRIRVVDRR